MTMMTSDRGMTGTMGGMMPGMMMAPMMMPMTGAMPMGMGQMPGMMPMPGMSNMPGMMVPRCTMRMEKMQGGMRVTCTCDDRTAAEMMKNLAMMMAGGMPSMCMMMNGMMSCMCNMGTMGMCKMDMTDMGMTMTCTSADPACMKLIQSCCDCMSAMMMPGCTCMMMMNGMPMCCMVC